MSSEREQADMNRPLVGPPSDPKTEAFSSPHDISNTQESAFWRQYMNEHRKCVDQGIPGTGMIYGESILRRYMDYVYGAPLLPRKNWFRRLLERIIG
jgi:hypothetical protein